MERCSILDEREEDEEGDGAKGQGDPGPAGGRRGERETGALRLERGGLDVGRPARARTTAQGKSSLFIPCQAGRAAAASSAATIPGPATAPVHKFAHITSKLPITGSRARLPGYRSQGHVRGRFAYRCPPLWRDYAGRRARLCNSSADAADRASSRVSESRPAPRILVYEWKSPVSNGEEPL